MRPPERKIAGRLLPPSNQWSASGVPIALGADIRGVFWGDELRRDPDAFARQIGAMLPICAQARCAPGPPSSCLSHGRRKASPCSWDAIR